MNWGALPSSSQQYAGLSGLTRPSGTAMAQSWGTPNWQELKGHITVTKEKEQEPRKDSATLARKTKCGWRPVAPTLIPEDEKRKQFAKRRKNHVAKMFCREPNNWQHSPMSSSTNHCESLVESVPIIRSSCFCQVFMSLAVGGYWFLEDGTANIWEN